MKFTPIIIVLIVIIYGLSLTINVLAYGWLGLLCLPIWAFAFYLGKK